MIRKSVMVVALCAATFLQSEEVSVFSAGNVNSNNPYGLTENEQLLLKNKQTVDNVKMHLDTTQENIEGLRSVVEGTNDRISNLENRVADLEIRKTGKASNNGEFAQMKSDIAWLKAQIEQINKQLNSNAVPVKKNSEAKSQDKAEVTSNSNANSEDTKSTNGFENKPLADVLQEADSLYSKKDYSSAKERYEFLVSKNYKSAKSNFMLGEIGYFSKDYAGAINQYKKSIALNEKGDYTPKLLYHTAISFDKIGDTDSGTKFYNALRAAYPDSPEAKASPNRK